MPTRRLVPKVEPQTITKIFFFLRLLKFLLVQHLKYSEAITRPRQSLFLRVLLLAKKSKKQHLEPSLSD